MILLTNFILTAGILMCLFIIFALSKKLQNAPHNQALMLIFGVLFFITIHFYSESNNLFWIYAISFPITDAVGFLTGPLFLIYVRLLYEPSDFKIQKHLVHFIPLLVYSLFVTLPIFYTICTGETLFPYQVYIQKYSFLLHLQGVYLLVYCCFSLYVLNKYQQLIKQHYSNLTSKDVKWMQLLLLGIILTVSLDIVITIYELVSHSIFTEAENVITLAMISMVLYLGYYGYSQSTILLPNYLFEKEITTKNTDEPSKASHHLANTSSSEIKILKAQLFELLKTEQPYLNEELTLAALADQLSITEKKLSALLNHYLDVNFYDFINGYRVEAVKRKLKSEKYAHYTILAIAMDCGFNSKI